MAVGIHGQSVLVSHSLGRGIGCAVPEVGQVLSSMGWQANKLVAAGGTVADWW